MEFFDKKEEVLEISLTQVGKQLYSQGKFNPVFYSFHDTDITYDDGSGEEQNDIVERIKTNLSIKQNTSVYQPKDIDSSDVISFKQNLYSGISDKTLLNQNKPSWKLNFIKSPPFAYVGNRFSPLDTKYYQIKMSSSIDSNNSNQDFIPQIDIQTIYYRTTVYGNGTKNYPFESHQKFKLYEDSISKTIGVGYFLETVTVDKIFFSLSGEKGILKQTEIHLYEATYDIQQNGKYIKTNDLGFFKESVHLIKDDPIIVNVDELNSFETYENEEFEVEVYLVEPYKQAKQLSFNQELDNNIYQYVNILFDNLADFEEKINTKDIYGDLVNRDDSNC